MKLAYCHLPLTPYLLLLHHKDELSKRTAVWLFLKKSYWFKAVFLGLVRANLLLFNVFIFKYTKTEGHHINLVYFQMSDSLFLKYYSVPYCTEQELI